MLGYVSRRVAATIPVMLFVAFFIFSLLYLAPGDPAAIIAGDQASPSDIAHIRASLGLDRPFLVRFGDWLWQVLHGNLGNSIFTNLPVSHMIAQRIEPTLSLMVLTTVIAVLIAVPLGVIAAWKQGSFIDRAVMVMAVLGFSVPVFVIGYVLAYVFALKLGWLPVQGFVPISRGVWPFLRTLILPSAALGLIYVALIARITRATMLEVLSQDYVRTARAKGVGSREVLFVHALKNAAVPIVTVIGNGVALLIGGAVVTETRVRDPRPGAADGRCDPAPRLPGDPGRGAAVFRHLRPGRICWSTCSTPCLTRGYAIERHRRAAAGDPAAARGAGPDRRLPRAATRRSPRAGRSSRSMLLIAIFAPVLTQVDPDGDRARPTHPRPVDGASGSAPTCWGGTSISRRSTAPASRCWSASRWRSWPRPLGTLVGVVAGFIRALDGIIMRVMDGLMSIPSDPARHRADGADAGLGAERHPRHLDRRVPPRRPPGARHRAQLARATLCRGGDRGGHAHAGHHLAPHHARTRSPPLMVQATFICASAMITEAILSFIGAGTPPTVPSWGNIMAEGRALWQIKPFIVFFPAVFLSVTVLAVNLVGDGLRDALDPRLAKRL